MSNKYSYRGFWIPTKVFFYLILISFVVFAGVVGYLINSSISTVMPPTVSTSDSQTSLQ